jgi:acetone carboxylase gamma subunit
MKVNITEYLAIDLDKEMWECRVCGHALFNARDNYKRGLLVHDRKLDEIHPHLLDPEKYQYTFCPDPKYTALLEYYCPSCGTMVETEYTVPGHPPARDIELDIDDLKKKASEWGATPGRPEIPEWKSPRHHHEHK